MDSTLASSLNDGSGMVNGSSGNDAAAPPLEQQQQLQEVDAAAAQVSEPQDSSTKSYDDLFPSLPVSTAPPAKAAGSSGAPIGEWNRKPLMFASSTVTQVFRIPMEERRDSSVGGADPSAAAANGNSFGSESSYKCLKKVMDKTGAKIEMSSSKDQSLTFLISGKQDIVLKARRELLKEFKTQASQTISIPKEHHRFILGKAGARLQDLELKTATKISIPKASDNSDKITITGFREGIEKAIHEIRTTSDEQSKQAYEVIKISKQFHPFVNGPGGETSRRLLADKPNVRINIPPLSVHKDEISVAGEKDGVMAVIQQIAKMQKEMERKFSEVSVEVKKSQHKYIIGPKGNSINEILADTGVFVEIPSSDSNSETITLRGPQEKLGLALTKVYERANSVVSYDISCPTWLHKYIIGKKGSQIQKLSSELPKVHVEFPDAGDKIKVEGPPDETEKAKETLEAQAADLIARMAFVEINVDAKYHKHIIGKGGSTVNKIKQETDVMINIPDTDHGTTSIRIEGNKEGVQKAKKELESLVSKMENEKEKDLIIESRFHRQLIGPKGENIQKLRDDFAAVQISFPDLGSKSDIVKLRGPREDVDKCTKVLNRTIRDLQENSYQEKIPIFKQFHKFIIGKGGATIRKIRSETDTRIELPESGSESDMIAITGKRENVLKAQKMIQQIQTEMADVVSADIQIPHKIHNTMIGSGGKLIQSVMDDCGGVSIKFPPPESNSDKVTLRGPKDDVEKARKMLLELANEKQLSSMSAEVRAKPEHHKFLIGRHGANVQTIRDKTGARIIFPGEKDTDREVITILGTKEAVEAAKKDLEAKIKGLDNVVEETMTVDPKHHRHFVARRGEVLRQIGVEFGGVIVSFPRSGVTSDQVTLKGAKNCLEAAKARILEIVSDLENQITMELVIDQVHHRTIMGARGCNLQRICGECDVQIKIPERPNRDRERDAARAVGQDQQQQETNGNGVSPNNIIKITGKKEKCERAAEALRDLVPVNVEVDVPYEFHRFIIGAKGAGVRQLMETYDVNIRVPQSEQQSNVITITGSKNNVQEARQGLMERVAELEKEKEDKAAKSYEIKLEVNPEYHPKIIGRKGAVISKLRQDYDVNVQLPKKGAPDEHVVTITGYEDQACKAREAILKIINDIENMAKEEVRIDPRVHSMIIGRRGAGIRKIMTDYKVDIKLPREGEGEPDVVTIMGDEDAVLDCKEHLLNIEEEFLQDIIDREWMDEYTRPKSKQDDQTNRKNQPSKGFQVSGGAPWQGTSDEAFPTLGGGGPGAAPAPSTPIWGPKR